MPFADHCARGRAAVDADTALEHLRARCAEAENSSIQVLRCFADRLPTYVPAGRSA